MQLHMKEPSTLVLRRSLKPKPPPHGMQLNDRRCATAEEGGLVKFIVYRTRELKKVSQDSTLTLKLQTPGNARLACASCSPKDHA